MNTAFPRFVPVSDHALLVEFAEAIGPDPAQEVLCLDNKINDHRPEGVIEVIPALVNLMVIFDPLVTDHNSVEQAVIPLMSDQTNASASAAHHQIEVCYDPDFAPDLPTIANVTGLDRTALINAHLDAEYRVGMYGFAPGYAYLTGLDPALHLPRKETAIRDIPAGSVIVAGGQCLVTTLTMPTGWSIIGRSPTQILRASDARPFLFNVGDHVSFTRIDRATFEARISEGM